MDNSKNMEPGIRNATVQESPNKEQRKKESRPVISAKVQTILDFLRGCSPYEADSIRVMVGYGTGNGDTATIEATDMLAVNRFLNHGLAKENGTSNEAVMKHRQERAQKLLEAHANGQAALWVSIYQQNFFAFGCKSNAQIFTGGGLAGAAFLVDDGNRSCFL